MHQIYNSDKPISTKGQDQFNRFKFSCRIAETIVNRNTEDGLVIGLYGVWGEGKSSVLNLIEKELNSNENIIVVKFNPWRFKDEDALMLNFLKNISDALDRELNTKQEKIGKFLAKYGSITSVFNIDLSRLGESISDSNLESLKERVNDFLKDCGKKAVIIIDDIDRLDKQELFALFKLVKLTGDFSNTYYVLSFDDEMVASSIGDRYAAGNMESGYNFLEKIIQVPLRIPQALPKDLLQYTFGILNETLHVNQIDLGKETEIVASQISRNLLPRIRTPRLAIRYANSLSFLIPLLKGEVNMADLILFEGVKIFYPEHYELIRKSPEYFIESYSGTYTRLSHDKKREEIKQKFDDLSRMFSRNETRGILGLLKHLFPFLEDAFDNVSYVSGTSRWAKEKRIASAKYFNRYFIYSVPKDDISDLEFEEYIKNLGEGNFDKVVTDTGEILSRVDPIEFLGKIGNYEDTFNWSQRQVIIKAICYYQDKFEGIKGGTILVGFFNPKSQAAMTAVQILERHNNAIERFEFARNLMRDIDDFQFAFEMLRWARTAKNVEDPALDTENISLLEEILLDRALRDSEQSNTTIFQLHSEHIYRWTEIWHRKSPKELKRYIDKCLKENRKFQDILIWEFTSEIYSSSHPKPYKIDFTHECYELLQKYHDVKKLYQLFQKKEYAPVRASQAKFFDRDHGQTRENAIRQFLYWYERDQEDAEAFENAESR